MLIPTTPARLASLVRSRILFILVSSSVAGLGALAIGLMTPYVYYSESLVQVESKPQMQDPLGQENTDLYKISLVANSAQVINEVAAELVKEPLDTAQAFPQSISMLDLGKRLKLITRHLKNSNGAEAAAPTGGGATPEVLASLLARHLRVDTDPSTRTVKVAYEAGDPNTARDICNRVTQHFLDATASIEQQELKRQEKYLESAIQQQLDAIKGIEGKMREIVERYPQMSSGKEEQRGTAIMAQRYLEKQELLRRLDNEIEENSRMMGTIQRDLALRKKTGNDVDEDVTNRIKDEINQLDYKRLQYTRVSGYSEDNPDIIAIRKRIKSLKRILNKGRDLSSVGEENTKSLNDRIPELRAKSRRLAIEKENVANQLKKESSTFHEVVKVNFTFDSLVRELNANAAITTELYRDLQKTRLNIAGSAARTVLLSPASLSVYASNVSVNKRTLFGFFVGMALGLSFLLLLDLIQPLLLLVEDLDLIRVGHFGVLKREKRCVSQIAYCIMSLKNTERRSAAVPSQSIAFFPVNLEFPYESYVFKVAQTLIDGKATVGILVIDDPDAKRRWKREDETLASVETLARDEVPARLEAKTAEMRQRYDWVFVLCPANADVPFAAFTAGAADHFFYVTQLGVSDLKSIQRVRLGVEKSAHLAHYALVFS